MQRVTFLVLLIFVVNILGAGLALGENGDNDPTPILPDTPSACSNEASAKTEKTVLVTLRFTIGSNGYYVNGQSKMMDATPIVREDRTLLPIRFVAEALAAEVRWDATERKVTINRDNDVVEMWIDNPTARVNGEYRPIDPQNPKVKPFIIPPGRTVLPLRFISESLGCQVNWDEERQEVTVLLEKAAEKERPKTELCLEYTFEKSDHSWTGNFTDLPADYEEDIYGLKFAHTVRPAEVGEGKALMLRGINRSDDLFMYVKKGLTAEDGIKPDTTYMARFKVEFATNAPAGAVGVGGPPGEAVWVKVGASPEEPVPVIEDHMGIPYYVLSVDKGMQNEDGEYALRVGDVAKEHCDDFDAYELKTLDNMDNPLKVNSDSEGNLWLFVGTDSGFEGKTVLYYTSIKVTLNPVEQLLCYIKEYDEKTRTLVYDEVEWVCHTDTSRVSELGLDINRDFPNGFYIYNEKEQLRSLEVSNQVKVYLVNLEDSGMPILTDMDGFTKRFAEYEAPYHLLISDGVVVEISEQYIP